LTAAKKHEALEHISMTMEATPAVASLYDKNNILIDCNMETVKLFGFTNKAKFIKEFNERFFDFSTEYQPCGTPTREKIIEVFRQTRLHGRIQLEWVHVNINGDEIPIYATLTEVEIEDMSLILVYDIDLRETRLARAKELQAMLTTLSHEMRTPLAVMSAYAEMVVRKIRSGEVNEKVLAALETISDESHRLATLATDTMDGFVKNAEEDSKEIINLGKMVTQLANMLIPTAKKQNISVVLNLPEHLPPIWGIVAELTRVVWNIFENALRHTNNGTVTISGDSQTTHGTKYVSITITDTGCGMTYEIKSRAFERCYSSGEKTGLGLTFCKEIIEAHGGEISIKSEPDKGCAITFILPQRDFLESTIF